jgi:thiol-disulfide isomerase/thioredoxin
MRNKSFKIAGFIVLAALLLVAYRAIVANVEPFREIPSRIANFSAIEIDGGKTTFDEQRGKATLVVLSASWCPACIAELNTLKNLHMEFSGKGFRILMVSEDDNVKIASRFKKKYAMPWTMVHWNYDLMNTLGNPRVIPVSYLVDSDGKFDYIEAGIIDENRMRRAIKALVD